MAGPGRRPSVGDIVAGLSVGLVLIPQAFAYATLAGMPPERGLLVAIAATLAAAPFASSPWLQTGPVAITALLTLGALEGLAPTGSDQYVQLGILLALMVGAIRLAIGLVGEGGIAYLLSRPVLAGFTPAAAFVIVLSQLPTALGSAAQGSVVVRAVRAIGDPRSIQLEALLLAALTIAILLLGRRLSPLVPVVLVVVGAGVAWGAWSGYDGATVGEVASVGLTLDLGLPWGRAASLAGTALVIAVVGFGEAAAIARTYALESRTRWDPDREFISQGAANLASGLVGGFPAGGSFSRSAIARTAGATSTWAGAISGVVVLAFLPFVDVLATLPTPVLAGIVVASVLKLLRPAELRELVQLSRPQFAIGLVTAVATLALAPRIQLALVIGIMLSIGWHLRRETLIGVDAWVDAEVLHLRPSGVLYFGSGHVVAERFLELLAEHRHMRGLVVHCDRLGRVDVSGALELRELLAEAERIGLDAEVQDLVPSGAKILTRVLQEQVGTPRWAPAHVRPLRRHGEGGSRRV